MNYYHFKNDISFEISLESVTTGQFLDPSVISVVRLFTRKNGRVYCACYGNNTLINNGDTVTVILNNHGLEPGVLQYEVVMQIPDSIYPDKFKKISQFYVSDIELVKGSGQTDYADVQQMFGTTIDEKFDEINNSVNSLSADNEVVKATIVSIQAKDAVQDASINNIEDIISGIHGDENAAISRLNSSVNNLETDVNNLNTSLGAVNTLVERMDSDLSDLSADLTNNYYTKTQSDDKFQVKGDYALKSDLDNINLTEYVKNSSLSENYPTNSSLSSNYAKKSEIQDFVSNSSVSSNYAKKSDLNNYPTNSSLSSNYVTKKYADQVYINSNLLETSQDEQDAYIAQTYLSQTDANENYVSYENIDEIIINTVDNNYTLQHKVIDLINTSTAVKDISTMNTNISNNNTNIQNVSTRLNSDYLTAQTVNADFVKNASLNTELTKYVLKSTAEETYLTSDDISTFKPIVFCTQEEYDALVENDQVDENTVYMLSGDQTGGDYLTPNDVSNFVTTNDISTFVTEDDASIYLTVNDVSNYITDASLENVWKKEGTNNNQLTLNNNIIQFDSNKYIKIGVDQYGAAGLNIFNNTGNSNFIGTSYNGIDIKWAGNQNSEQQYTYSPQYTWEHSEKIGFYDKNTEYSWNKRMSAIGGIGALKHIDSHDQSIKLYYFNLRRPDKLNDNNSYAEIYELLNSGNWQNYIDVSNFITENDASIYLTDNDVSVYATTSYVDTQIGNIQNILQTI